VSSEPVKKITRAIRGLTQRELVELYVWPDRNCPQPIDTSIPSDLEAGRMDTAILRALDDEAHGGVRTFF
jgi:hypothetical protein